MAVKAGKLYGSWSAGGHHTTLVTMMYESTTGSFFSCPMYLEYSTHIRGHSNKPAATSRTREYEYVAPSVRRRPPTP